MIGIMKRYVKGESKSINEFGVATCIFGALATALYLFVAIYIIG